MSYILRKGVSGIRDLKDGLAFASGDAGIGNVWYVNGGSDGPTGPGASGNKPDDPFQTIKEALAVCKSNNNDFIYVLNYGSNGRGAEDWPIVVDKDLVHIIGCRSTAGSKWPTIKPDESDNAFTVTGQRVEFANLEIGGYSAGSAIQTGSASGVWGTTVHDCWFGITGDTAGTHGIYVASDADAPYLTVYDCMFGPYLTGDGIRISGNATRCFLGLPGHGNFFRKIVGIAINVAGAAGDGSIFDNRFQMAADTAGDAITLSASTSGWFVSGNECGCTEAAKTTKYYADATTNGNDWAGNYVSGSLLWPT